jgi:predicted DNA-binding transcriptional regulator YafY
MRNTLQNAIDTRALVLFIYNGKQRAVQPLVLLPTADWHTILKANDFTDNGIVKSFRLDRIESGVTVVPIQVQSLPMERYTHTDPTVDCDTSIKERKHVKKHSKEWKAIDKAFITLERATHQANTDIEDAMLDLWDRLLQLVAGESVDADVTEIK